MSSQPIDDLVRYAEQLGRSARRASESLATIDAHRKSDVLARFAQLIRESVSRLLEANRSDVAAAEGAGLAPPLVERLKLNEKRIESMAAGVEQIAQQPDPVGQTIESRTRPDGLRI